MLAALLLLAASGVAKIPPPLNPSRADLAAQTLAQVCLSHTGERALTAAEVETRRSQDVEPRATAPEWLLAYLPAGVTPTFVLEYPTTDDESDAYAVSFADRRCMVVVRGVAPSIPEENVRGMMRYWHASAARAPRSRIPGVMHARFSMPNIDWRLETRTSTDAAERGGVLILTSIPRTR